MVEYALILILIAIVVIVVLTVVGHQVSDVFKNVSGGDLTREAGAPRPPVPALRSVPA